jgi:hypothetical protein
MNFLKRIWPWWSLATAVFGALVVYNALFVSGNLADALAGQPPLGDESTLQIVTLVVVGLALIVGGILFAIIGWSGRQRGLRRGSSTSWT